jgi:hypothetical protein
MSRSRALGLGALALIGAALALVSACGDSGPSDSQYSKVKQELQDQQSANQQLQQQLADAKKASTAGSPAAPAGTAAAAATTAAPAAVGVIPLLGAKSVTPAPPAPTPTPLPAGVTPPPKATPPASYYQTVGPYFIYVETLATTTVSKYNVASSISCTPSGAFARGQRIVFRYDVVDMATGKRLTDQDSATIVKVVLPNGDESVGRWSQRGGGQVPDAPWMFSSNWDIPTDYPLGAVDYKIVITPKDGKSFTWSPPYLTSVPLKEDTRPKVIQ